MTKKRMVDTRFWHDSWVRSLNSLDRYLFLYLITNDKCSFCGIYELPVSIMAFESGIDERDLEKVMLPRLEPKVLYHDGWVCLTNFKKHHVSEDSTASMKGYESALALVPSHILEFFNSKCETPYRPPTGCPGTSAFASASISYASEEALGEESDFTVESVDDTGEPIKPRKEKLPKKGRHVTLAQKYMDYRGFKYKTEADHMRALYRNMKPAAQLLEGHTPEEILACMKWCDEKYKGNYTLETIVKKIDEYEK